MCSVISRVFRGFSALQLCYIYQPPNWKMWICCDSLKKESQSMWWESWFLTLVSMTFTCDMMIQLYKFWILPTLQISILDKIVNFFFRLSVSDRIKADCLRYIFYHIVSLKFTHPRYVILSRIYVFIMKFQSLKLNFATALGFYWEVTKIFLWNLISCKIPTSKISVVQHPN